jgi:antitoxin (DNA-binding transcriptional repressor) of toxin-antitoxin stability system
MRHVGIRRARRELPRLIDRPEASEEVMMTRQRKRVAKLVAAPRARTPLPSLKEFRGRIGRLGTPASHLVREERGG